MSQLIKTLDNLENVLEKYEVGFIILMFVVMTTAAFAQVVFRYLLEVPFASSEEIARYAMVSMIYIGGALGVLKNTHIRLDFIGNVVKSEQAKKTINTLVDVVSLFVVAVFLVWSTEFLHYAYTHEQKSAAMDMPYWLPMSTVAISMALCVYHTVLRLLKTLTRYQVIAPAGTAEEACEL